MDYRLTNLPRIEFNVLDWRNIRAIQVETRLDCHAAFTVTQNGKIWPFSSRGHSLKEWQIDVRGWIEPLDRLADEFSRSRRVPGRFLLSRRYYAFWKEEERGPEFPFAVIDLNRILAVSKKT